MRLTGPLSEQLFNCSDTYACFRCQLASQTPNLDPTPASLGPSRGSRLAHRALSGLWQARLPLRLRPRSRPQILFIGQLPQGSAPTAIPLAAAARPGASRVKELSARARSVGTDMRHQSRTLAPPGESLSDAAGGLADRSSAGGSSGRHYASGLPSGGCVFGFASFGGRHSL